MGLVPSDFFLVDLFGFAVAEAARNSGLKSLRHLLLGIVGAVSVFDQTHQRAHQYDYRLLPPLSRESQCLRYVAEFSALPVSLALPRRIELLFSP
jgi:hypothetical protein